MMAGKNNRSSLKGFLACLSHPQAPADHAAVQTSPGIKSNVWVANAMSICLQPPQRSAVVSAWVQHVNGTDDSRCAARSFRVGGKLQF